MFNLPTYANQNRVALWLLDVVELTPESENSSNPKKFVIPVVFFFYPSR